jgi:hypothetical protein
VFAFPLHLFCRIQVYAGGLNSGVDENTVLFEYLASHGYVVASVASQGDGWVNARTDARSAAAATHDLAFAVAAAGRRLNAEPASLAAAGFSMGAVAALWLSARDPSITAVVALDPSFAVARHHAIAAADPCLTPDRATAALLVIHAVHHDTDLRLVESLAHAERRIRRMRGLRHLDFTAYAPVQYQFGDQKAAPSVQRGGYERVCRGTRAFLDATFRGRSMPREGRYLPAVPASPDEDTLARAARAGVDSALRWLDQAAAIHPDAPALASDALERVAAGLWSTGACAPALAVLEWATVWHPGSLSLHRTAAEALLLAGQKCRAAGLLRRALALATGDPDAEADIHRALTRTTAPGAPGVCQGRIDTGQKGALRRE